MEKPKTDVLPPGIFPHPAPLPHPAPTPTPGPTTEHLGPAAGNPWTVAADPTIDVTFVAPSSHAGIITLGNGLVDGFRKTIEMDGLNNGGVTIVPTSFGDGKQINIPSGNPGAAILTWDAKQSLWHMTSLWNATTSS